MSPDAEAKHNLNPNCVGLSRLIQRVLCMKLVRCFSLLLLLQLLPGLSVRAQESQLVKLSTNIEYQPIGRWDADQLNKILQVDTPAFAGIGNL
jgi:hypothetical protein